jgi:methionyl-tRNA synthetase
LGNAVSRTAAMISRYQKGLIGDIPPAEHDVGPYRESLEACRFDKALEEVWEQVKGLNQYIDEQKPWMIAKTGDEDHLREVLASMVGMLLEISELLLPFMPGTSEKIQEIFGSGLLKELPAPMFPKHNQPAK